jgi:hypothetical protein
MNTNYEPCFFNVSEDWRERWSLIREFSTKWHGIQFSERKEFLPLVKKEEEKLGFKLSPSFQEYIIFYADINKQERWEIIRDMYRVEYDCKLSTVSLFLSINVNNAIAIIF